MLRAERYRVLPLAFAVALAAAIGTSVWRIPVQVSDSYGEILAAQRNESVTAAFDAGMRSSSYFRPLRIAQIKLLFDLSDGEYQLAYRGFHVALVVALLLLFVRLLPVETPYDAAAAAFALMVLTGIHTFIGFVREAFPINHFLEIAVLCLVASNLSEAKRPRWWIDVAAAVVLAVAALTLESGVLVWVVLAVGWLVGFRGVSWRGVVLATVVLGGYFALRTVYLDTGLPGLSEREAGFLLERLDPAELEARFGQLPQWFYAYNVAASLGSVLLSEPRDGVFVAVRAWLDGDVPPRVWLWILSSVATTALIGWAFASRLRTSALGTDERRCLVAAAVVAASAVLSYAYTKDEIMAVSGVYYAFCAYAAARVLLATVSGAATVAATIAVSIFLAALSSAWAVRSIGVHHVLRTQVERVRNDWASIPLELQRERQGPQDAATITLIERLRSHAIGTGPVGSYPEWQNRWFGN